MMRISIAVAAAFLSLPALIAAPAPIYRPPISPDLEAIFQAAEDHVRSADRISKHLNLECHSLTPKEKARLLDERMLALRGAAERYTRLIGRVESVKHLHPEVRELAERAGVQAVKSLHDLGEHAKAVRLFDGLAYRPTEPKALLSMRATIVSCRMNLNQIEEARKQLLLMRKELTKLDETDRIAWERWLALVAKEIEEYQKG